MTLREIQGENMRDALERARAEVGERAIVVRHSKSRGGGVVLAVSNEVPHSVEALQTLRTEARDLLASSPASAPERRPNPLKDVERSLRSTGCSRELVQRVLEATSLSKDASQHPLDAAAEYIGSLFDIATARRHTGTLSVMAFVGLTGVGKTTTIAKLAFRLLRAKRRVALATLETNRVVDSLGAYAKLLGIPLVEASTEALRSARERYDVVLLDTTGDVDGDAQRLLDMFDGFGGPTSDLRLETYFVLSAETSRAALEATAKSVAELRPAGCVVTKLDESRIVGPLLEKLLDLGLPVAFLSRRRQLQRGLPSRLGTVLRRPRVAREAGVSGRVAELAEPRLAAPFLFVTGGKGGVGKTTLAANLAVQLQRSGLKTLVVDLDLGLANVDILMDLEPGSSIEDALAGRCGFEACVSPGPAGVRVLRGGSGVESMGRLESEKREALVTELARLSAGYDVVVGDSAAGIGPDVMAFASLADRVLVVTTPEAPALSDAYGLIKALDEHGQRLGTEIPTPEVIVNLATDLEHGRTVARKLRLVCERFLSRSPRTGGLATAVASSGRERRPSPPLCAFLPGWAGGFVSGSDRGALCAHRPDWPD